MNRMIGITLALGFAAVLVGCATPLQQCLYDADQTSVELQRELDTRRLNLRYGFSIERVMMPVMAPGLCPGPGGIPTTCFLWEQDVQEIRHPINPEIERERIALLEHQLAREVPRAQQAAAQCRATYPAS